MIDKVQKIRKEVERLKSNLIHGACSSQIAMETNCKEEAYNEVLAILDTLQEETISEEQVKESAKTQHVNETCKEKVNSLTQEPVSEDLDDAAIEYCGGNKGSDVRVRGGFLAGAKWQKEQIEEALLSEVLPCFMHGGEADEVVAKLDEVLNKKQL